MFGRNPCPEIPLKITVYYVCPQNHTHPHLMNLSPPPPQKKKQQNASMLVGELCLTLIVAVLPAVHFFHPFPRRHCAVVSFSLHLSRSDLVVKQSKNIMVDTNTVHSKNKCFLVFPNKKIVTQCDISGLMYS